MKKLTINLLVYLVFQMALCAQSIYSVLLDPGHGGLNALGATGICGVLEKNENLEYSNKTVDEINNDLTHLWVAWRTRNSDTDVPINDRWNMANNTGGNWVDADGYIIPAG